MRIKSVTQLCILVIALPVLAHAQINTQVGDSDTDIPNPDVLRPFGIQSMSLQSQLRRSDYLDAGVEVTTAFDDNALNLSTNPRSDLSCTFLPEIGLRESRGRTDWRLSYAGGYTLHQRLDTYNSGFQDVGLQGTYKLSEHSNVTAANGFVRTTGFVGGLEDGSSTVPSTVLNQSNSAVVTPLASNTSNTTLLRIDDQLTQTSVVGGAATFVWSHYNDTQPSARLIDSTSQEADAYYNRILSPNTSVGITYRFLGLTFTSINNRTTVNSVLATYTLRPRQSVVVTLYAGPQRVIVDSVSSAITAPFHRSYVSGMGGASLVWNGRYGAATASFSREVSDGGGLLGPVTWTNVSAQIKKQLSRNWFGEFGIGYGISDSLATPGISSSSVKNTTLTSTVSRQWAEWGFGLGYARVWQNQAISGIADTNHNRAWISVSYRFSRALGRN